MQVHPYLTASPGDHILGEFNINRIAGHFIIGQIDRLKTIFLTQLLESRQIAGILCRNPIVVLPQIIAFGVDGNDKCRMAHTDTSSS